MWTWDPDRYLTYADERARPFVDLVSRIGALDPSTVVDLGCGAGNLTVTLKQRWPSADVLGIDSSPEMIAKAPSADVRFEVGSIEQWHQPADVVVSNAALQWIPGHLRLLPRLADGARGWFAFQVPGNFEAPTHTIGRDLAADTRFSTYLDGVDEPDAFGPEVYLEVLRREGWNVDAWETTYLHVLTGDDAVFTWGRGLHVGQCHWARPTIEALPDGLREDFVRELKARLHEAYAPGEGGIVMPFRRVFVVANR
jgi:trans-aconitate 2-methyltransferase